MPKLRVVLHRRALNTQHQDASELNPGTTHIEVTEISLTEVGSLKGNI